MSNIPTMSMIIILFFSSVVHSEEMTSISRIELIRALKGNCTFNSEAVVTGKIKPEDFRRSLELEKAVEKYFPPSVPIRNQGEKDYLLRSTNLVFNFDDIEYNSLHLEKKIKTVVLRSKFSFEYGSPELSQQQIVSIEKSYDALFNKLKKSIRNHLPVISADDTDKYLNNQLDVIKWEIKNPTSHFFKKELKPEDIESVYQTFDLRLGLTKSLSIEKLNEVRSNQDYSEEIKKQIEEPIIRMSFMQMLEPVTSQIRKRTKVQGAKSLDGYSPDDFVQGYNELRKKISKMRSSIEAREYAEYEKERKAANILDNLKNHGVFRDSENIINREIDVPLAISTESISTSANTGTNDKSDKEIKQNPVVKTVKADEVSGKIVTHDSEAKTDGGAGSGNFMLLVISSSVIIIAVVISGIYIARQRTA